MKLSPEDRKKVLDEIVEHPGSTPQFRELIEIKKTALRIALEAVDDEMRENGMSPELFSKRTVTERELFAWCELGEIYQSK